MTLGAPLTDSQQATPPARRVAPSLLAAVTVAAAACAPPPEVRVAGEPAITIAYPASDGQVVALTCLPDPAYDCAAPDAGVDPFYEALDLLVVVDVDNVSLRDPYEQGVDLVDGEGHWHAEIGGLAGYQAASERSARIVADRADLTLGFTRLTVTLQDNLHNDLPGDRTRDSVEFELVPSPVACDTLPPDPCDPT